MPDVGAAAPGDEGRFTFGDGRMLDPQRTVVRGEDGEIQPRKIGKSWLVVAGAKGKHLAGIGYYKSKPDQMEFE